MRAEWYTKTILNIHFDHHVEPNTPVGAGADPDELASLIAPAKPGFIQYHSKGHPGWTNYPTRLGGVPPKLVKDALAIYRKVSEKLGIRFTVYYSGLKDEYAAREHPEWRRRDARNEFIGSDVLCPNSGYVEARVLPQLKEIIEAYNPDGFWFDGDCWSVAPCYCSSCRKAFMEAYGREPPENPQDPLWKTWMVFHRESFVNYLKKCADFIHKLSPNCLFTSNWSFTIRMPDSPPDFIDWLSADISPTHGPLQASFEARFLSTRGKPFDLMTALQAFTWSSNTPYPKYPVHLFQEGAVIMANGGKWFIWINPLEDDSLQPSHMRIVAECAEFAYARAEAFKESEPLHEVALLHSALNFYEVGSGLYDYGRVLDPLRGAHKALQELHYLFDIVDEEALINRLNMYKAVILAEQSLIPKTTVEALMEFAWKGGVLIAAGKTLINHLDEFMEIFGFKHLEFNAILRGWIPFRGEKILVNKPWHRILLGEATQMLPLSASGKESSDDEIGTAVSISKYGSGRAVYVASDIFGAYWFEQYPKIREIVGFILDRVITRSLELDAPPTVEVVLRKQADSMLLHFCNLSVYKDLSGNSFYVEDIPPIRNLKFKLKLERKPIELKLIPPESSIRWIYLDGVLEAELEEVKMHSTVKIIF
ncbi:alpha-L-fucosidase [Candidatus Bathyarchaeota archaeon]|nr:alpha-L-fucosidase [Candidatus Bathyarchaeota archaeon]